MDAALDLLLGQFRKPAFDLVQPTGRSWREMDVPVRTAGKPGFDLWGLVRLRRVGVHHQMDLRPLRQVTVQFLEDVQKLLCTAALIAFSAHRAGCDIQRGKKRSRSVANVRMRPSLGHTGGHWQDGLLSIQCRICDFSSKHRTIARLGGDMYSPTTSCTLSTNKGSVDSLKVSNRCGCRPKAFQIRRIVVCEYPVSAAMDRIDQWVASFGVVSSVCLMTSAT